MKLLDLSGEITKKGEMLLANQGMLAEFKRLNKGKKITVQFKLYEEDGIERMRSYFYGIVVPNVRRNMFELGVAYSDNQVINVLMSISPITENMTLDELNHEQWVAFLNSVNDYAKTDLGIVLNDLWVIG